MSQVVVRTTQVKRTFRTGQVEVHALRGVDLDVCQGEFVAVAGPSGSGKTTLFNLLGGLDEPTSGQVFVDDMDLSRMNARQLSRLRLDKIGFVFQAYNLIPVLTAYENIEYPLILKGRSATERKQKVEELLEIVGLKDMMHRRPTQMSGGQQQRVAVARALVCEPVVVLADEPTANLDSKTGQSLIEHMRSLNQDKGLTFLFSTHDPMVMDAARRLIILRDGRIVSDEVRTPQVGAGQFA